MYNLGMRFPKNRLKDTYPNYLGPLGGQKIKSLFLT